MANLGEVKVPASHLGRNMTIVVKVTGLKILKFRLWMALKILWLAGHIAGSKCKIIKGDNNG